MMAFDDRSLGDYIDVAQRIADFRALYPNGSLREHRPWEIVTVQAPWCRECIGRRTAKVRGNWQKCPRCGGTGLRGEDEPPYDMFVAYVAAAYRTPDDQTPGIGVAWEPYPGRTPYTAASELQNAETSAWGRAIIAALASDSKAGVASRDEVRNRRAERDDGLPTNADGSVSRSQTTDEQKDAAGVMTDAQHQEHTQLQKGTARGRVAGAKRTRGPIPAGEDMWSVPVATGTTDVAKIQQHFRRLQVKDRDERLQYIADLTGHAVTTTNDLTEDEKKQLADALATCKNLEALKAKAKQEVST